MNTNTQVHKNASGITKLWRSSHLNALKVKAPASSLTGARAPVSFLGTTERP